MDILSLGKEPISSDQPAGSDARYDQVFEELQAEIDKLSIPSASGGTDWKTVDRLSTEILANKSKDLLAASYLAVAQIYTRKFDGFSVGLRVYRDLLENFWEELFPAKKRMRGRIAAIEWWVEKTDAALQQVQPDPLPAEKIEEYRQDIQQIGRLLQEYVDAPPLLRPIERFIENLPYKKEADAEAEAPQPAVQEAGSNAAAGPPPQQAQPRLSQPAQQTAQAPSQTEPRPAVPPEKLVSSLEGEKLFSSSDTERVMRAALQAMRRVADYHYDQDLSNPRSYRWRRIAGWAMILALPPATKGLTGIDAPVNCAAFRDELTGLKSRQNWQALLRTAEERFHGALLWLDLNRFVSDALAGLGDQYQMAHEAVCQETAFFVYRVPGIETMSFSDGTSFCDGETRQWLNTIRPGGGVSAVESVLTAGPEDGGHMAETIKKAQEMAKQKKVREAIVMLQQGLRASYSKREQMLWRLGLTQVLVNAGQTQLAFPHLESLIQDIDTYRLEEWDPDLALKGFKMVWQGFSGQEDESFKGRTTDVLNRIARLDPAEAIVFAKR